MALNMFFMEPGKTCKDPQRILWGIGNTRED